MMMFLMSNLDYQFILIFNLCDGNLSTYVFDLRILLCTRDKNNLLCIIMCLHSEYVNYRHHPSLVIHLNLLFFYSPLLNSNGTFPDTWSATETLFKYLSHAAFCVSPCSTFAADILTRTRVQILVLLLYSLKLNKSFQGRLILNVILYWSHREKQKPTTIFRTNQVHNLCDPHM